MEDLSSVSRCAVVYDCESDAKFLFDETDYKKIVLHPIFETFINLKNIFPCDIDSPPRATSSLKEMLATLGLSF